MPPVEEYLAPKQPLKTPKAVNPTKVSLDLAPDQEKSFRAAGPATSDTQRVQEAEASRICCGPAARTTSPGREQV